MQHIVSSIHVFMHVQVEHNSDGLAVTGLYRHTELKLICEEGRNMRNPEAANVLFVNHVK